MEQDYAHDYSRKKKLRKLLVKKWNENIIYSFMKIQDDIPEHFERHPVLLFLLVTAGIWSFIHFASPNREVEGIKYYLTDGFETD